MPEHGTTDRLVLLHGFTQTHHHWHRPARAIADALGIRPSLAYVDLPGHGLSSADRSDIGRAATDLPALAGPGTWIGYSMGARFALLAALSAPHEIERLVLIGATAGIADPTERSARADLDDQRADHLERIGLDAFLDEWLAMPMFAGLPDDPDDLAHRRRNRTTGLTRSLRTAGTGHQEPVWERLAAIAVPTLVIAGAHDVKFTALGRELAEGLLHGTFVTIENAGHAAHSEQPGRVAAAIAAWSREPTSPADQPIASPIASRTP